MVTWPSLGGLSEVPGAGTRPVGCREGSVGGGLIFFLPGARSPAEAPPGPKVGLESPTSTVSFGSDLLVTRARVGRAVSSIFTRWKQFAQRPLSSREADLKLKCRVFFCR